jgi:Aromatic amino acid lyase
MNARFHALAAGCRSGWRRAARSRPATPVCASGDLAQLAHLAQPLIGAGRLRLPGDRLIGRPAAEVLREPGLEPLTPAPKEGLSLVNGTEPMQALLAFSVSDADMLVQAADVACALSVEALLGTDRPYDERVQIIRPHPGQLVSATNLRALLAGSELLASQRARLPGRGDHLRHPGHRPAGVRRRAERAAEGRARRGAFASTGDGHRPGGGRPARAVDDLLPQICRTALEALPTFQ